jgi:hypothetical protein
MARTTWVEILMFWLMLAAGYAVLAPCLVLPAWLEYEAQLSQLRDRDAAVTALDEQVRQAKKQIDRNKNDPAYILRLAEREFGLSIATPNIAVIPVQPSPPRDDAPPAAGAASSPPIQDVLPELSAFLEQAVARYPYARLFVHETTRPVLLAMSGGLLVTAIMLLGGWGRQRGAPPAA